MKTIVIIFLCAYLLLLVANLIDYINWVRCGRPEPRFTEEDTFTDGEYD